ncbi:MAG: ATP-dependent DNA helicase RecG, partial [Alphaproteobacteria bacterium]|nr:ATP-dependent DNA helicase RecG [Alphaproteobacteria bacterium]
MRPEILYSLFQPVTRLAGVGPRIGKLIEKVAGPRLVDLLWHLPGGVIDRRFAPKVAEAPDGAIATLTVTVEAHQPPPDRARHHQPYRVVCADSTGRIELVFFHARRDYLEKILPVGATRLVSGRVGHFRGQLQMPHPDHVAAPEAFADLARVEPVYP